MKLRITSLFFILSLVLIPSFLPLQAQVTTGGNSVKLVNPIQPPKTGPLACQNNTNIKCIVGNAIKIALGIVGSITLVAFVYGGYNWLTSAGDDEKIRIGTNALMYATIGLFIIFGAYAILNTILKGIAK